MEKFHLSQRKLNPLLISVICYSRAGRSGRGSNSSLSKDALLPLRRENAAFVPPLILIPLPVPPSLLDLMFMVSQHRCVAITNDYQQRLCFKNIDKFSTLQENIPCQTLLFFYSSSFKSILHNSEDLLFYFALFFSFLSSGSGHGRATARQLLGCCVSLFRAGLHSSVGRGRQRLVLNRRMFREHPFAFQLL